MKKFYALMAAGVTVLGVSAVNPIEVPLSKAETMTIHNENLKPCVAPASHVKGMQEMAFSRADEEVTFEPATFTQVLFYDYFANWTNSDGSDASSFRDLESGSGVTMTENEDGTITIEGLCGYNFTCTLKYDEEEAAYYFELGETVLENDNYVYKLVSYDFDNQALITEGTLPSYKIYTNAITFYDWLGAYAYNKKTGKGAGFGGFFYINMFIQPNATLSYSVDKKNSTTGEYETFDYSNRIYAEYVEADTEEDPEALDYIYLSNVTYYNDGFGVNFEYYQNIWMATDQIAMGTQQVSETEYTGDFYVMGCFTYEGKVYMDDTLVIADETETGLTWPVANTELEINDDRWGVLSKEGYGYIASSNATFAFDQEDTDGIKDVEMVENTNAPAVYYNIQGMQVANPVAGQLYIVKQGEKVSKQVLR